jgi:hypothetical protein
MTNSVPIKVEKYLNKFAVGNWKLNFRPGAKINNVIVIPAICEYENLRMLLDSLLENDPKYFRSTLILFVINNSASSNEVVKNDNLKSLLFLKQLVLRKDINNEPLVEKALASDLSFAFVDAAANRNELPEKKQRCRACKKNWAGPCINCS